MLAAIWILFIFYAVLMILLIKKTGILSPISQLLIYLLLAIFFRHYVVATYGEVVLTGSQARAYSLDDVIEAMSWCVAVALMFTVTSIKSKVNNTKHISQIRHLSPAVALRAQTVLFFVGLSCAAIYMGGMISVFGSIGEVYRVFNTRVSENVKGLAYLGILSVVPNITALISFWFYKAWNLKGAAKWMAIANVSLSIFMLGMAGGRGNLLAFIISVVMIKSFATGRGTFVKTRSLFILSALIVFVLFVGLVNRLSLQSNNSWEDIYSELSSSVITNVSSNFSTIDHYVLAKSYVDANGHDYGAIYANVLLRPIPRAIWPEKPMPISIELRYEFWGDTLGGIPPGYIGESYISFGYFGVLFSAIFIVMIFARLNKMSLNIHNKIDVLKVCVFSPIFIFGLIRGGVDVFFAKALIAMFIFFIVFKILRIAVGGKLVCE